MVKVSTSIISKRYSIIINSINDNTSTKIFIEHSQNLNLLVNLINKKLIVYKYLSSSFVILEILKA